MFLKKQFHYDRYWYQYGINLIDRSSPDAFPYFYKAAVSGSVYAAAGLGYCLYFGIGTTLSVDEGMLYLKKASSLGIGSAQYILDVEADMMYFGAFYTNGGRFSRKRFYPGSLSDVAVYDREKLSKSIESQEVLHVKRENDRDRLREILVYNIKNKCVWFSFIERMDGQEGINTLIDLYPLPGNEVRRWIIAKLIQLGAGYVIEEIQKEDGDKIIQSYVSDIIEKNREERERKIEEKEREEVICKLLQVKDESTFIKELEKGIFDSDFYHKLGEELAKNEDYERFEIIINSFLPFWIKDIVFKYCASAATCHIKEDNVSLFGLAIKIKYGFIKISDNNDIEKLSELSGFFDIELQLLALLDIDNIEEYVLEVCMWYIENGDEETLDELSRLTKYETESTGIIQQFLNCGNKTLYNAAELWAHEHGRTVVTEHLGYGNKYIKWGSSE